MDNGYWLRIREAGMDWRYVRPEPSSDEVDMVRLVVAAPEFLGALDQGPGVVRAVAPAPGSSTGRLLVAVGPEGRVELVACPGADPAERSALLGDILATSGRLWHQPYDALAGPMAEALGAPLAERVGQRAGKDWSVEAFEAGVGRSLAEGRFPVVIVSRETNGPLKEMADYLQNMTFKVRFLGYSYLVAGGVEILQPAARAAADRGTARPGSPGQRPAPVSRPGELPRGEQHTTVANINRPGKVERKPGEYAPFPADGVAPEQRAVLERLVMLDDTGLVRRGFEFFVPGDEDKDGAEGAVVVAMDKDRWPFPKKPEVVVVVNTGHNFLAGYLNLSPEEIEEFLNSLPRVQRKEHKGCLLLRASNVQEADQLVNELRALCEVAQTGV